MSVVTRAYLAPDQAHLVVTFDEGRAVSFPLTSKSAFRLAAFFSAMEVGLVEDLDFDDATGALVDPDIVGREIDEDVARRSGVVPIEELSSAQKELVLALIAAQEARST